MTSFAIIHNLLRENVGIQARNNFSSCCEDSKSKILTLYSQGQNRIIVLLNDPLSPDDNISVIVDRCGDAIEISNVKRRNPYVLQFSIPERCLEVSMLVGVRISKNDRALGVRQIKCESRLRELDQILRAHDNPLEFMCQVIRL